MKKTRKKLTLLLVMAVTLSMILSVDTTAFAAGSPSSYESLVPDENFRAAIDKAFEDEELADLNHLETVQAVKEEMAKFKGEVKAVSKGIVNVNGLQWLTKAEKVDLSKNKIVDWSVLDLKDKHTEEEAKKYYGFKDDAGELHDVVWKIGGNPFSILPENFGGRWSLNNLQLLLLFMTSISVQEYIFAEVSLTANYLISPVV